MRKLDAHGAAPAPARPVSPRRAAAPSRGGSRKAKDDRLDRPKGPEPVALDGELGGAAAASHGGGFSLGDAKAQVQHKESGHVVVDQALADVALALIDDPRITYDLKGDTFLAMLNEAAGGGVSVTDLWKLQRDFDVPKITDIRKRVVHDISLTMSELHKERGIETAVEMVDVLRDERGIDVKNALTIKSFRRWEPDLVPRFLEGKKDRYAAELQQLVDEINAQPDTSYSDVARGLKITPARAGMLMLEIRNRWPDALPEARQKELWTPEEVEILQQALDDAPLGTTLPDLVATLRSEAPEIFDRHPLENEGVLRQQLNRSFGINDWTLYKEQQYATAFADLLSRSPPETSLTEIVEELRDDNPRAYSYVSVWRLLKKWVADPKGFPEIAALRDDDGKFPWQRARVRYSPELAKRLGKEIAAHPGKGLQYYVDRLKADPAFAKKYPTFTTRNIQNLRGLYPEHVPYVTSLQVKGREARLEAWKAETLDVAERAAAAADAVADPSGLTLAYLARKIGEPREKIGHAIRAHPAQFPWFQASETPRRLDLELAMRAAVEMSQAPMGTTRGQLIDKMNADEAVKGDYLRLKDSVIDQLRRRYPDLIPDWKVRGQVLRSKLLRDAVFNAPKGKAFDEVLRDVVKQNPSDFMMPWASPTYVRRLWENNPERFPFLDALKKGGKLVLEGRGTPPPPDDESDLQLANRLSRVEQLPDRLPVIDQIVKRSHKQTFRGFDFLFVQHLLGAQAVMFDALLKMGVSKTRSTVVGVPYSSSADITDVMVDKGWDVRRPPLDVAATEEAVREAMKERIAAAEESGNKIIVIDDGGMVAQLLDSDPELKAHADLFRIVEQTTRGITVANAVELHTAVVNVAQSWGKYIEGPMTGESLQVKAMERLARIGVTSLEGKKIGVIGAGTIGLPWAEYLRKQGAIVTVLDIGEAAREKAKAAGFAVADDRKAFFSKQDIIFGGTGVQSITAADLEYLKDGAILGSGSSKLVEIDVAALDRQSHARVIDDDGQPPTVEYKLKGNRKVKLLARGFPLNFDGSSEIVAHEKMQLVMALLMMGAIQATSSNVASVLSLDPQLQLDVLEYFSREEVASEKEIAEALALAQAELKKLAPAA